MQRLIARTMLLVLLAGVFSPFAAASTMAMQHTHCNRKPVAAPASSEMSECHHHKATAPQSTPTSSDEVLGGKDCCQDHECCRTMARSQWAHASLRSVPNELGHAAQKSPALDSKILSFELALNHPGRAPPIL